MPRRKQRCPQKRELTINDDNEPIPANDAVDPVRVTVDGVLDLTTKKRKRAETDGHPIVQSLQPSTQASPPVARPSSALDQLSSLVSKVGQRAPTLASAPQNPLPVPSPHSLTMQELWWKYIKKEENAELKRMNEAKRIFTCLQCQCSFQSMDSLVKHMEVSQHFTNVPKHYSWSLQYARQKMRQMKMKLKYSERMMYFCQLCATPFSAPVHQHFCDVHDMHSPVENMNFVQIVMMDSRTPTPGSSVHSPSPPGRSGVDAPDLLLSKMEDFINKAVSP